MAKIRNIYINPIETQVLTFSVTDTVKKLTPAQKVNQKVVLSFYGYKIDMPFRLVDGIQDIVLRRDLAVIPGATHQTVESYKVEITHPWGKMYFRVDIPKDVTASQMDADAFSIAELNMRNKREFENYLIDRKQYDLDFQSMDLGHRQARVNRKYEYVAKGIDTVLGTATLGVTSWRAGTILSNWLGGGERTYKTKLIPFKGPGLVPVDNSYYPTGAFGYTWFMRTQRTGPRPEIGYKGKEMMALSALGAYKGASGLASGIAGLTSASERARLQEESFALQIREKALQSYQIDLGYEREKDEQLMTMRRIFSNQTYNDVASRKTQQALDRLEAEGVEDIYLELWTTSEIQENYVNDYHLKFGVDCRLRDYSLNFRDEIPLGIYCIEDVVIENLSDRVDFEFLRARLTGGIKFVEWKEHEKIKELTPVDARIQELEKQLSRVRRQYQADEATIQQLRNNIAQLTQGRDSYFDKSTQLESELKTSKETIATKERELVTRRQEVQGKDQQIQSLRGQLEPKERRIQTLTKQIAQKEEEVKHYQDSNKLYVERNNKLTQDLATEKSEREKEREEASRGLREKDSKIEQITRENEQNKQEVTRLNQQFTQTTEQLQAKTRDYDAMLQEKNRLEATATERQQKITELETQVALWDTEQKRDAYCQKHIAWRDRKIKQEERKVSDGQRALRQEKQKVADLQRQLQTLETEKATWQQQLQEKDETIKGLRELERGQERQIHDVGLITGNIESFWRYQCFENVFQDKPLQQISERRAVVVKANNNTSFSIGVIFHVRVHANKQHYYIPFLVDTNETALYRSEYYGGFALKQNTIIQPSYFKSYKSYFNVKVAKWSDVTTHVLGLGRDKSPLFNVCSKYNYLFTEVPFPLFVTHNFRRIEDVYLDDFVIISTDNNDDEDSMKLMKQRRGYKTSNEIYWNPNLEWFTYERTRQETNDEVKENKKIDTLEKYIEVMLGFHPWGGEYVKVSDLEDAS